MDEVARIQAIDASQSRIDNVQRQVSDALENQRTHSVSHQMRSAGQAIGTVGAGAMGAPGILADLSGYLAGKTAEELTVLLGALSNAFTDAHRAGHRHEERLYNHGLPIHLGRQEA